MLAISQKNLEINNFYRREAEGSWELPLLGPRQIIEY